MQSDGHSSRPPQHANLLVANHIQVPFNFPQPSSPPKELRPIKVPPLRMAVTRSTRARTSSVASGSEYHESNASMDVDTKQPSPEQPPSPPVELTTTRRGRVIQRKSYLESSDDDRSLHESDLMNPPDEIGELPTTNGIADDDNGEDGEENASGYKLRSSRRPPPAQRNVVVSDGEGDANVKSTRYKTRSQSRYPVPLHAEPNGRARRLQRRTGGSRSQASVPTRQSTRRTRQKEKEEQASDFIFEPSSGEGEGSPDDAVQTSSEPEPEEDLDADGDLDIEAEVGQEEQQQLQGKGKYGLRQKPRVNYAVLPPLEEMSRPPPPKPRTGGGRYVRNGGYGGGGRNKAPGWSATGAELSRWMGGGDDSDSDHAMRTPRKPFGAGAGGGVFAGNAAGAGGLLPGDLAAAAGTPSNLGKIGDASLADADPLGVNQNVTFDEVGGLDDHINALKEMTLLPLLYPEVFQRFNLTPPRGVLFHGPPGTGKTLLARALAASCRSNGKGISFFMRKGADCLSKWVGEAERQLRLLFEEARNSQPSIIFFDEIDGLAPVRSSKQDQIHASIVSTLLALMDGMDGRGQVVVIGATNRPDAVDPALRRPGRFDREFYFPLPSLEARERILRIMTRKWAGWEGERGEQHAKGLAKLTKGYGGADLRALCTEAALNAVQRRYPQIYKSTDRLLLKPETIDVELRDFMLSVKKMIPSSARATASAASPLPTQLVPLLENALDKMKAVIAKVLPVSKKRTALEEAEWEDEGSEGALEREMLMQSMETLRVYRPRVVLHGPVGMGQGYVAAAALHHLEGYHVQSLDLGNLLSDSTRTPEAAIVQLFVEAKRHQPSVIYIPSLIGWCAAVSETSRTTVRAMLDSLAPTDPVLLLAVVDGPFSSLPRDVRAWFGPTRDNRVELTSPTVQQRDQFFQGLLEDVRRPPNHFPDGVTRKRRILEELPLAPPLEPRQPTAAELALQEENDQRVITLLKYRLGPILTELKRKFKRFTKRAMEEYNFNPEPPNPQVETVTTTVEVQAANGDVVEIVQEEHTNQVPEPQLIALDGVAEQPAETQAPVQPEPEPLPKLYDMDLERMHVELYKSKYLSPDEFLDDIRKIVQNACIRAHEDVDRLWRAQAMLTAAEVSIQDFDPQFRLECNRMAVREHKRREERKKSKDKEKAGEEGGPNGSIYPPGTRRSARTNGQQPEIPLTDPLQLERRLKRQRSAEINATPSEDETSEGRLSKRSKVGSNEADGVAGPSTPQRAPIVRFADDIGRPHTPVAPWPLVNGVASNLSTPQRKATGFDPTLLNPLPEPEEPQPASETFNHVTHITSSEALLSQQPLTTQANGSLAPPPGQSPASPAAINGSTVNLQPPPADEPMQIERSPTPLPEFRCDEGLISDLARDLRESTHLLTVEQLEQLRATCLGCAWRHRTAWDRASLISELRGIVREFVEEVSLDDMDFASSPGH